MDCKITETDKDSNIDKMDMVFQKNNGNMKQLNEKLDDMGLEIKEGPDAGNKQWMKRKVTKQKEIQYR